MRYVSVDVMVEELGKLKEYVSIFDSEYFQNVMHVLKKDAGFELPDCNDCKYGLKDYQGIVRKCANDKRAKQNQESPYNIMAMCGYYQGVSE